MLCSYVCPLFFLPKIFCIFRLVFIYIQDTIFHFLFLVIYCYFFILYSLSVVLFLTSM